LDTKKDLEGGDSNEKDSSLKLTANENESKDMIHAKKDVIYIYIIINSNYYIKRKKIFLFD